jgi:4-hydroxy 2-oxovalerate aldolase
MLSGANSLPQKEVMDWVTARYYSLNSIIRALDNQSQGVKDNEKFEVLVAPKVENVIIIGGGPSAKSHVQGVKEFIAENKNIAIIHASSKNAAEYVDIDVPQYFCLVGNEGHRMEQILENLTDFQGKCVLPPFPRKMGTYVPQQIRNKCFELEQIQFIDKLSDSHTTLALQTASNLEPNNIFLIGYDGYLNSNLSTIERNLAEENASIFSKFIKATQLELISLSPSMYSELTVQSVYSNLY